MQNTAGINLSTNMVNSSKVKTTRSSDAVKAIYALPRKARSKRTFIEFSFDDLS